MPPARSPAERSGTWLHRIRESIAEGWVPPVAELVGFRLTEIGRGTARMELRADRRHENPMGTLHGGILCDVADAAMGMSYLSLLSPDESFTTVELKVNFLRPFWSGRLVASGRVIRKGRTMGLVECRVRDGRGRLLAFATCTCMTLRSGTGGLKRARGAGTGGRPREGLAGQRLSR